MPNIYFAPPARPDPYAFANRDALMQVFDVIGKSKRENFETELLERYLSGEKDFSSLMGQEEPEGFFGRMWDVVNPKGTYRGGVGGLSPFTQRVLGQAMGLNSPSEFPLGLTGPQLEAWGFTPEQWAERNIRRLREPPKRPKAVEESWHEVDKKKATPEQTITDKVSEAQSNPDVAAETYRQSLEALGYGDEDIEQLKQIFKEGDAEKIKQAIERIGI